MLYLPPKLSPGSVGVELVLVVVVTTNLKMAICKQDLFLWKSCLVRAHTQLVRSIPSWGIYGKANDWCFSLSFPYLFPKMQWKNVLGRGFKKKKEIYFGNFPRMLQLVGKLLSHFLRSSFNIPSLCSIIFMEWAMPMQHYGYSREQTSSNLGDKLLQYLPQ